MCQELDVHWTLVVVVMNIMLPRKTHKFFTNRNTVGFLKTKTFHNLRLVWV